MAMPKYAASVDANQNDIVTALTDAGCDVIFIKKPVDLLVGRADKNYLLEVKRPKSKGCRAGRETKDQKKFFLSWRGQKALVRTAEEALTAVGLQGSQT